MKLDRSISFLAILAVSFLLPIAIPGVGIDYAYFFIMALVLLAWFAIKWSSVRSLVAKGTLPEIILGIGIVGTDYAQNIFRGSNLGLLDMIFIFCGVSFAFYGIRSFRLFWVPVTYGVVLLLGYQIQTYVPNFVALQNWMASVMASAMRLLGVQATLSGHIVYLNSGSTVLGLNVEGDCTGVQGILAFGMLSTMAVLDIKSKPSKIVPLFVVGFIGAFLINIVRLFGVFLAFEYLGTEIGNDVHVYLGYFLFIVWVMVFWSIAFRYLVPGPPSGSFSAETTLPLGKRPSEHL